LSPKPLFFLINSYTAGFSPTVLANILKMTVVKRFGGVVTAVKWGYLFHLPVLFFHAAFMPVGRHRKNELLRNNGIDIILRTIICWW